MTEKQLIRRAEAAKLIGVTPRTINRYVAAGRLQPLHSLYRGQFVPHYYRADVLALRPECSAP